MSTLQGRKALERLSPITREVMERMNLLHQQDWTFEQKQAVQEQMMRQLTPEQKAIVEREALAAAMALQFSNPAQGNRETRRRLRIERARRGRK